MSLTFGPVLIPWPHTVRLTPRMVLAELPQGPTTVLVFVRPAVDDHIVARRTVLPLLPFAEIARLFAHPVQLWLRAWAVGQRIEAGLYASFPTPPEPPVTLEHTPFTVGGLFCGQIVRFPQDRKFPDRPMAEIRDVFDRVVRGQLRDAGTRFLQLEGIEPTEDRA